MTKKENRIKLILKIGLYSLIGIVILILVFSSITCVSASNRGIKYTFGKANETVLQPGINFHAPLFEKVKQYSIVPNKMGIDILVDGNGAISKDNQVIGTRIVVYYKYNEDRIYEVATKYKSRSSIENPLASLTNSTMKSIIGKYSIFEIAENQNTISSELEKELKLKTAQYPIDITQVNVSNFDWSPDFDRQINETMEAAQRVRKAEQEAQIAEQENKKLSIEAEARAKAEIAKAEGELQAAQLRAKALITEAEGIAEANRIRSTGESFQYQKAEWEHQEKMAEYQRWNGKKVPDYLPITASGAIIDVTKKQN